MCSAILSCDNTITYQGVRTEMVRENGRYWMKFTGVDGKKQQLEIVRTVGSRRIQQYLTKSGDQWVRLPIAYDLVQRRWMHLNGSFFYPDGTDYKQHVAEWNLNCVFCHNVKAQPNLDWTSQSGIRRSPNWALPVAPVTGRQASTPNALFLRLLDISGM